MNTFDPTKPVKTRAGHKARILCTDSQFSDDDWPIHALVEKGGREISLMYRKDGSYGGLSEHPLDLINAPEIVTVWITLHKRTRGVVAIAHASEIGASLYAQHNPESYLTTHSTEVTLP